jgi:putative transposase
LDHVPPFWVAENPDYFITICAMPRGKNQLCLPTVGPEILRAIHHYHERGRWFCHLAVLMPDHVHFLLSFQDIPSFARPIGEWKKWLVKRCNIDWQENFFDHRIRNKDQDRWKADYILYNPVRAGLVKSWEDWPYKWMPG